MKVGDLVPVFYSRHFGNVKLVDTSGLIVAIHGHKAQVIADGEIETWDISDLKKMKKDKMKIVGDSYETR